MTQKYWIVGMVSFGLMLGISGKTVAQMPHDKMQPSGIEQTTQFRRIAQPLWLKSAVTAGGVGLIGVELWWFLLSKSKSRKADTAQGIQEATITVDGGYEPDRIVVRVGQPVKLNFDRRDPSSCLEQVRFPDFGIAQDLKLNQVTPVEFTPQSPGQYSFTCGMNMFRGTVDVQAESPSLTADSVQVEPLSSQ